MFLHIQVKIICIQNIQLPECICRSITNFRLNLNDPLKGDFLNKECTIKIIFKQDFEIIVYIAIFLIRLNVAIFPCYAYCFI